MQVETTKKLFTVRDVFRMVDAGIFDSKDRVELIEGEILLMSPIGHHHRVCVNRANRLFIRRLDDRAVVSIQNAVELNEYTMPQPDIVIFKPRADDYAGKWALPEDVLLTIEVAQTSLAYDRGRKLALYAQAGVPEFWIEDLQHDLLLVYREPAARKYKTSLTLRRGESIAPLAFPDITFSVDELLVEVPEELR